MIWRMCEFAPLVRVPVALVDLHIVDSKRTRMSLNESPDRPMAPSPNRRSAPVRSLLWTLVAGAMLAWVIVSIDPVVLLAGPAVSGARQSYNQMHREFARTMAGMMSHCVDVLVVHDRNAVPDGGVVLWMRDDVNPGQIDPHEIAILCHSALFRTVMVYTLADAEKCAGSSATGQGTSPGGRSALSRALVASPDFCNSWRMLPCVRPEIIGTGISDMRTDRLPGRTGELSLLRLSLTWGPNSSDGAGEASALIELRH